MLVRWDIIMEVLQSSRSLDKKQKKPETNCVWQMLLYFDFFLLSCSYPVSSHMFMFLCCWSTCPPPRPPKVLCAWVCYATPSSVWPGLALPWQTTPDTPTHFSKALHGPWLVFCLLWPLSWPDRPSQVHLLLCPRGACFKAPAFEASIEKNSCTECQ